MEYPHLQADVLTQMATGVKFPEGQLPLSRMFMDSTSLDTDQDVAAWDETLPIRTLDTEFETRDSRATNTASGTAKPRTASMALSFKKRMVKPEVLRFLRPVGGNGRASTAQSLALMIGDMVRRYWYEKWEYLIVGALMDAMSFTIGGVTHAPDFGLPVSHDITAATAWTTTTVDIDAEVETMKRVVAEDSGRTLRRLLCGRDVKGTVRKNDNVKEWYVNRESAPASLREFDQDAFTLYGVDWVTITAGYIASGPTWTPYIPDKHIIGIPEIAQDWFLTLHGPVMYPEAVLAGVEGFGVTNGIAAWAEMQSEPPSAWYFQRWTGLPILAFPAAVVNYDTTGP